MRTHATRLGHVTAWLARIFGLALLLAAGPCIADMLEGRVVAIQDGDTLTVLDSSKTQRRVRLAGIDAPEKGQPWGNHSKEGLSSLAYGKQVEVQWHKRDRYGRMVGKVLVEGCDVNLAQVSSGLAWHYAEYAREQSPDDRQRYAAAQETARQRRLGLWADREPIPPWDFRRARRTFNRSR
ncbi:thermonuclease family protein [uncultured Piscinibacter sp.]|uniref:thermonuclease family protein n=1 Tax=uncultured Piscinibacter sp. TaxID=1131835 RepID=UPI002632BACA|nr:thermonuclease family protein [uncultured Piscinibacter sp.]